MASVQIKINGTPAPVTNITLGSTVTLTNGDNVGVSSWSWQLSDVPTGSTASLSAPTASSTTFVADKEGTYLIRLTINGAISGTGIAAVLQIVSGLRFPAFQEKLEHTARGWTTSVNEALSQFGVETRTGEVVVCQSTSSLTIGKAVRVSGATTLTNGQSIATVTNAAASSTATMPGIGVAIDAAGGSGVNIRVRTAGLLSEFTFDTSTAAVGDPVFISNTGDLSLTAGTNSQTIGHVATISASGNIFVATGLSADVPDASPTTPGKVSTTTQTFAGDKTFNGNLTTAANLYTTQGEKLTFDGATAAKYLSSNGTTLTLTGLNFAAPNISGTNTGDITLGVFGSSPNADGASLSGQILTLQPASGTQPGGVSTTTQTFAGNKTLTGTLTSTASSGNTLVFDTNTLIVDATNHRVGIGQATPTSQLHVTGTVAAASSAVLFDITGSGSGSGGFQATKIFLNAGYTGLYASSALTVINGTSTTATSLSNNSGNFGLLAESLGTGSGTNAGVFGAAYNGTGLNVGVYGQSFQAINNATNVAILGQGLNTGSSSKQIGGYFLLSGPAGTDPGNFTSAALIADNGTTSSPIFLARVNGTARFTVDSSGNSTITGGTLANDGSTNWLSLTGTLPSSPTAGVTGVNFNVTSAGSAAQIQEAMLVTLAAGFTGARTTTGFSASNNAAGNVAQNLVGLTGNIGVEGQSHATVTTSTNWGVLGEAQNGAISVGVGAIAKIAKNSATNIGVLGLALNTGTSPIQIGGFFGLYGASDPTFTSAALIADNGSTTSPIFLARDNGTTFFTVDDGGTVTAANTVTINPASASSKALIIKEAASQTGNLIELQDSSSVAYLAWGPQQTTNTGASSVITMNWAPTYNVGNGNRILAHLNPTFDPPNGGDSNSHVTIKGETYLGKIDKTSTGAFNGSTQTTFQSQIYKLTSGTANGVIAEWADAFVENTGTVTELVGFKSRIGSGILGTVAVSVTDAHAFRGGATIHASGGSFTNFYGLRVDAPVNTNGSTIGTHYGLRLEDAKVTGVTTAYGVYQLGASVTNQFAGPIIANGTVTVNPTTASDKALIIKEQTSQTGDLLEIQDSGGTAYFSVIPNSTGPKILFTPTITAAAWQPVILNPTFQPAATTNGSLVGLKNWTNFVTGSSINLGSGTYASIESLADIYGTGTIVSVGAVRAALDVFGAVTMTTGYGVYGNINQTTTATITNAIAVRAGLVGNASGGTISSYYGFKSETPTGISSGTVTNAYGIYLDNSAVTGVTTAYGVFQVGASVLNQFAGRVDHTVASGSNAVTLLQGARLTWDGTTGAKYLSSDGTTLTSTGLKVSAPGLISTPSASTVGVQITAAASQSAALLQMTDSTSANSIAFFDVSTNGPIFSLTPTHTNTGNIFSSYLVPVFAPSANNTAHPVGFKVEACAGLTNGTSTISFTQFMVGLQGQLDRFTSGDTAMGVGTLGSYANLNASGTVTKGVGLWGLIQNVVAGTITNAYSINATLTNVASSTVTTYAGLYVDTLPTTGTITTAYGTYIDTIKTAAVGTAYGIWQNGASDLNRFNGKTLFTSSLQTTQGQKLTFDDGTEAKYLSSNGTILSLTGLNFQVAGVIESTSTGFKFPDTTVQATAVSISTATASWTPAASLSAGQYDSTTVTLTGAAVGDPIMVGFSGAVSGCITKAEVYSTNTVTVYLWNISGASVSPTAGTITVKKTTP